jgi:regulator of replication initiation timing
MIHIESLFSNPLIIGDKTVYPNKIELVSKNDFELWASTKVGKTLIDSDAVLIVDPDEVKKQKTEKEILTAKIRGEIDREVKSLKTENKVLKKRISELENALYTKPEESEESDTSENSEPNDNMVDPDFKFDPEIHHIEHRGGGNWFVMNQEEKVYGPITDEEKQTFESKIDGVL